MNNATLRPASATFYRPDGTSCTVRVDADGELVTTSAPYPSRETIAHLAPDLVALADERKAAVAKAAAAERKRRHPGCTVIASIGRDSSGVGMRARSVWLDSELPTPKSAGEGADIHGGGDYPRLAAIIEAEERARRVATVRAIGRVGYSLAEYDDAVEVLSDRLQRAVRTRGEE